MTTETPELEMNRAYHRGDRVRVQVGEYNRERLVLSPSRARTVVISISVLARGAYSFVLREVDDCSSQRRGQIESKPLLLGFGTIGEKDPEFKDCVELIKMCGESAR